MPLQIVIEDVGWWQGTDGSKYNQPFRTGMKRRHCPEDYEVLALLGKKLNMRPQLAFIICEWDKENILKRVPSTTWMGKNWDNSHNVGPWLEETVDILQKNRSYIEIGLHGVGHEYWVDGRLLRSEFHDSEGNMRDKMILKQHLELFGKILEKNSIAPFPESFTPPALHHSFGNGTKGFQNILREFGIKYVTTIFRRAKNYLPELPVELFSECGVILVERGEAPVPWHQIAAQPKFTFDRPVLSLHWSNLLHSNPAKNIEITGKWINYIKNKSNKYGQITSPDTSSCWTQYAYRTLTRINRSRNGFELDFTKVKKLPEEALVDYFVVHLKSETKIRWKIQGGRLSHPDHTTSRYQSFRLYPEKGSDKIFLYAEHSTAAS